MVRDDGERGVRTVVEWSIVVSERLTLEFERSQVWELSEAAVAFLARAFAAYDDDGDGLLSWQQLDAMFSTIPPPVWQV